MPHLVQRRVKELLQRRPGHGDSLLGGQAGALLALQPTLGKGDVLLHSIFDLAPTSALNITIFNRFGRF